MLFFHFKLMYGIHFFYDEYNKEKLVYRPVSLAGSVEIVWIFTWVKDKRIYRRYDIEMETHIFLNYNNQKIYLFSYIDSMNKVH